jgi:hypothetical protein
MASSAASPNDAVAPVSGTDTPNTIGPAGIALYWLVPLPPLAVVALVPPAGAVVAALPAVVAVELLDFDDEPQAASTSPPAATRAKARELFFMDCSPLRELLLRST